MHVLLQANISFVLMDQGKHEEAKQMLNEALQIELAVFGEGSYQVSRTRRDIGNINKE